MFKKIFGKEFLIFLIFIIVTGLIYDYPKILTYRPKGVHQWRQIDGASIALNYYADTLSFFKPSIQLSLTNGNNKAVSEFPIIYFSVAILWKIFGYHEFIFRLLNLLIVYIGLFYLFKFLRKFLESDFWAIGITSLIFSSPLLVYYSNNFVPNAPALGLVLIGWYYFYKFFKVNRTIYIYLCLFFFLFAGLLKITSLISFFILLLIFIIDISQLIKLKGEKRLFNKPILQFIPFLVLTFVIIAWYIFARNYNSRNVSDVFLQIASPIWDLNFGQINNIFNCIFNLMLPHLLSKFLFQLILVLFIILIICYKRVNKILMIITITSFLGCTAYFLLFYTHFEFHDYYQMDLLIFPLAVIVSFVHFLKTNYSGFLNMRLAKCIFSFLIFCSIIYCASYTRLQYDPNDVFARYAFFIDYRTKDNIAAVQADVRANFGSCETVTPYLRSLGIIRTDKVISMGDYSPNISLYLMDQKGYTNYCLGQSIEKFTPEMFQELHSKYLILLENKWLEKDYLKPFLKYKMGEHGNISIFDLRPFMQLEKK